MDTPVSRYYCAPAQQNVALHPFIEQLSHVARLIPGDPPGERVAKLAAVLAGCREADRALIANLIVPGTVPNSVRDASPKLQLLRVLNALLASVLHRTADAPLLIVFEDAHWSDPTTRELLGKIVGTAAAHRLLLIVTARPQFRPDWASRPGVRRVELDPLAPEDSERLVRSTACQAPLAQDLVADIVLRSDGVPLYIEEVTRSVLESGGADQSVPASLHASLLSRIDRLGRASGIAEIAATIGRAFDLALLEAVCDVPKTEMSDALDRLVASGLVQHSDCGGETMYVFRHALIRDTAYGTIVRGRRRAIHARIAQTLEQDFSAEAAAQPQQLALHYAAAALDWKAASWWLRAGLQSLQRSAMAEARVQLQSALSLLEAPATPRTGRAGRLWKGADGDAGPRGRGNRRRLRPRPHFMRQIGRSAAVADRAVRAVDTSCLPGASHRGRGPRSRAARPGDPAGRRAVASDGLLHLWLHEPAVGPYRSGHRPAAGRYRALRPGTPA